MTNNRPEQDLEQRRDDLLRMAIENERVAKALQRVSEATLRTPTPVMVNTGQVRYSTSTR